MKYITFILAFLVVISVVCVIMTIYDKLAAKRKTRRIPEKTLLLAGFLGGASAMFITMLIIRHKTRHAKFMILLPLISALHIVLLTYLYFNIA